MFWRTTKVVLYINYINNACAPISKELIRKQMRSVIPFCSLLCCEGAWCGCSVPLPLHKLEQLVWAGVPSIGV